MTTTISGAVVFPARVGMSPLSFTQDAFAARFPRPRGDEPVAKGVPLPKDAFSPPAWG